MTLQTRFSRSGAVFMAILVAAANANAADGVFVRFKLAEPAGAQYFVRLGGYIHESPWRLPGAVVPEGSDRQTEKRAVAGRFTPWFDVKRSAGNRLHGSMNRAGGVSEWPNVTAEFVVEPKAERLTVVIELATAPRDDAVAKRWKESFSGSLTSFLVSPDLERDARHLETAAEMTARRLKWAREATGGKRRSPKSLIVQTSFWSPQRPELNLQEAEVLHLLGFNVVGNQMPEVRERFDFVAPGHTHGIGFGPAVTRDAIETVMAKQAEGLAAGEPSTKDLSLIPFGFGDEVCCRPRIGDDARALAHFHAWLAEQGIEPRDVGVAKLTDVTPIETPDVLRLREERDGPAARRVFYHTSRFRQHAATERVRWHTEAFHEHLEKARARLRGGKRRADESTIMTSTLVADHPYFSGTGMGMGMTPNPAWSGHPLAMDWFDLARRHAVDLAGIEDWMGLQYMYGPNYTWEGFQLMGFQATIFRSGSRGQLPIIAWITPSDETNLRLKTASALCQGAKHFFYWTYGPTATSTENYWSDLRGAHAGVAAVTRQLAAAEHVIAPGRTRPTRLALLYSISSDLWQPFGYVHMLERRGTYLSLVHDHYLVDMLTEEDIEAGRLADYDVLYATDPCIKRAAAAKIVDWVAGGGHIHATTATGSRDEFNEPSDLLARTFGIAPEIEVETQPGSYHIRGALNAMKYLDRTRGGGPSPGGALSLGALGARVRFQRTTARLLATFEDGSPAVVESSPGAGKALYVGTCPALSYIKEANFVPLKLEERWPADLRGFINRVARQRKLSRPVELSHPVVEAGVYDADAGSAVVLANFTYEPIERLTIRLRVSRPVRRVRSVERGAIPFALEPESSDDREKLVRIDVPLGLSDVILFE